MFEELNKRRQTVAYNIAKSFRNDIEKAIGAGYDLEGGDGDDVEKAHQVGDVHPNGKWVWTEYAPGKFDWRGIKKNATEKTAKKMGWLREEDEKVTGSKRNADVGSITLKITKNGSGVVKLSDSVNAKWQDVKDEDFGGRIIGIKIDGKLGAKAFPYSFDSMKRKKYDLYTFEEAKAEAEKYLNNEKLKLTQQG